MNESGLIYTDANEKKRNQFAKPPITQKANLENLTCPICNMASITINRKDCTILSKIAFHNNCVLKPHAKEILIKGFFKNIDVSKTGIEKTTEEAVSLFSKIYRRSFYNLGGASDLYRTMISNAKKFEINIDFVNDIYICLSESKSEISATA